MSMSQHSPTDDREPKAQAERIARGLFPHQVEGVAFLMGRRRSILADDMGLGKTRQAIVALTHTEFEGPYLVICPASVKRNWVREIAVADPETPAHIIGPDAPPDPGWKGWVIVNYDILKRHYETLAAFPWKGILFDEAHYLKNHTSQRSRLGRKLIDECEGDPVVYALTGTPLTSRPRDLFVLLQIAGHPMGRSFLSFAKRYCGAYHNDYGWVTDGASNLEELALQLQGILLRRNKEEVLDLPPKFRTWLDVEVGEGTARREMEVALGMLMQGQRAQATGAPGEMPEGRDRGRLLAQLTKVRKRLAEAKTATTIEFVQSALDQGEKVLVFSCFDAPVQRIHERFEDVSVLITGATPADKRQGLVDRFQEEEQVRVFVANILAGGVGLNLTAARQVVFNDLDWVPANHWQAEDRAYRIGQQGTVQATYMVAAGTVDEFVRAVLETKAALVAGVVDGEALGEEVGRDVLSELERLVGALSPRLADTGEEELTGERVRELLRQARDEYRAEHTEVEATFSQDTLPELSDRALEALVQVLRGPQQVRYRVESNSKPGEFYEIAVEGADLVCACKGFEYRGTCSHVRTLKGALAKGGALPDGVTRVEE
jgi:SWI/SNF-related matrix-associated actin-dependent regulator of chromatin subfamily A-like protein 1